MIPGLGRSSGEGIGYPPKYSWAPLVAQLVKNPPAMWETWVQSLSWEDPLDKGKATHSSILAWRILSMDCPWGRKELDTTEQISLFHEARVQVESQDPGVRIVKGKLIKTILSLLQGIFPTQVSNPGLPHCRQILYQLSHKGSPRILEWVA